LTEANVEIVLDEVRPYLMADGGNVEFVEIDGPVVYLRQVLTYVVKGSEFVDLYMYILYRYLMHADCKVLVGLAPHH